MILESPQSAVFKQVSGGRVVRRFGLAIMILALAAIAVTFAILMGLTPIAPTQDVIWMAMGVNGFLALLLVLAIGWEIGKLISARRKGRAGARLHVRIVALFSVLAGVPAILMAILGAITLDRRLDRWFEDRTRNIIDNALVVAKAYLNEHGSVLRADLIAMANDVDRSRAIYDFEPTRFDSFFQAQAQVRGMLGAFIINSKGEVITRVVADPRATVIVPPRWTIAQAKTGEPIMIAPGKSNLVGGVMKLAAFDDFYLYGVRVIDPRVIEYMNLAEAGASEYAELETSRFGVQVAFALVYLGVALVLLLSAIWIGFGFANRLVAHIRTLISAADEVSKGKLAVKVVKAK